MSIDTEESEAKAEVGFTERPKLIDSSKKLVIMINSFQNEEVSISKAVREMRNLFDSLESQPVRKNFFKNLVFMLQV
jgi:hypothetical protein